MEKVQVLSVKPICTERDECLYSDHESDFGTTTSVSSEHYFPSKSSVHSNDITVRNNNNNYASARKEKSNSSFKNAFSRASIKHQLVLNNGDKGLGNNNKSGLLLSSNCFGRASYNEKIKTGSSHQQQQFSSSVKGKRGGKEVTRDFVYFTPNSVIRSGLYKSNSSLELEHEPQEDNIPGNQHFKREYGSHGSINVSVPQQEALESVFQNYQQESNVLSLESQSPKVRSKISRLWERDRPSILKKLLPSKSIDAKEDKIEITSDIGSSLGDLIIKNGNASKSVSMEIEVTKEDTSISKMMTRPAIAHYDCRSLAAQMNPGRLKTLLADRSNTTTGASAASMSDLSSKSGGSHSSSEDLIAMENPMDSRCNHMISICPFFLNEIGGEYERVVSLSREVVCSPRQSTGLLDSSMLHRPSNASSSGLLEPISGSSNWCQNLCPYVKRSPTLEIIDQGAQFYETHFKSQEHQNWFGVDDSLGPVAISIKKEKTDDPTVDTSHGFPSYQFRFIFRTADLFTCQGTIREECLAQKTDKLKGHGTKEAIEYICPNLNLSCLRAGIQSTETEEALIKIDELSVHKKFKVGVMYCRAGQQTEDEMYNNRSSGPALSEFLEVLGQRVRLKDFDKHRGGLDKKTDSTGHYSVYTQYKGTEIMFHVSTLLPFTPNNQKQLLRKRHIGNDIVTIIFQEPGSLPFSPKHIRSHFQHVFIVVQAINPCTDSTQYSVSVSRFQDVPMFGPPIPEGGTFPKSKKFTDFLLAKVINGEIAALRSEKFVCMAARTKHEYLKDLSLHRSSGSVTLDTTASKFSLMGFSRASKKEKVNRFKFVADSTVRGALSWKLALYDATLQKNVDCVLGVSVDTLVVLEESSSSVVFSIPCKSVLGWTSKSRQGMHIFYHQGECLILNLRHGISHSCADEILQEVTARLQAVTQGAESQEFVLKRNSSGLLGFNVQQDGIITEVEPYGLAAQSKLLQGSRLVEICTVALSTLSQEQMVDLLKTSLTVTVTVIPPHEDASPRRGCNVPTCSFLLGGTEGDYENLTPPEMTSNSHLKKKKNRVRQLARCDRSISPPRSGNSSGYGTGSSSHSFSLDQHQKTMGGVTDPAYISNNDLPLPKDKISCYMNPGDSVPLKYSDYTSTMSSTSSTHSYDRWGDHVSEDAYSKAPPVYQHLYPPQRHSPFLHGATHHGSSPIPPPLPMRAYQKDFDPHYIQGSSSIPSGGEDISSPQRRRLKGQFPTGMLLPDQGNYSVPSHTVSRSVVDPTDTSRSDCETSSSKYSFRAPAGVKNKDPRRNSSPLTLEAREEPEIDAGAYKRESLYRTRHSIPKSEEEARSNYEFLGTVSKSEDDLTTSCGNSTNALTKTRGSNNSSRTQSPHSPLSLPHIKGDMGPPTGLPPSAIRLKSAASAFKNNQNRNSASLASTNFQEELLKLINPDYLSDSESIGAEIRNKKRSSPSESSTRRPRAFPTYDIPSENSSSHCGNPRKNAPSSSEPLPSDAAAASHPGRSDHGLYEECPPQAPIYQTIGEVEFSNRKNVFAHRHSDSDGDGIKKSSASDDFLLTARPATVISNASTTSSPAHMIANSSNSAYGATKASSPTNCDRLNGNVKSRLLPLSNSVHEYSSLTGENDTNVVHPPQPSSAVDDEWTNLVTAATMAIEETNAEKQGFVKQATEPESKIETDCGNISSTLPLAAQFMNSIPEEFHKHMPAYFERFLADSNRANSDDCVKSRRSSNDDFLEPNGGLDGAPDPLPPPLPPPPPPESAYSQAVMSSTTDETTRHLVEQLERALATEQRISGRLKEEVDHLRSENNKLLHDSRAAAQQLHQFTEWFFTNINKG